MLRSPTRCSSRKRRTQEPRRLTSFTRFLHSITFKASAGLAQQFRRHREIALSSSNMDVAKVGGELWQELLHVSSRAIPRNQTVNGGGVAKVMKSWLIASSIMAYNACAETHSAEGPFRRLYR